MEGDSGVVHAKPSTMPDLDKGLLSEFEIGIVSACRCTNTRSSHRNGPSEQDCLNNHPCSDHPVAIKR